MLNLENNVSLSVQSNAELQDKCRKTYMSVEEPGVGIGNMLEVLGAGRLLALLLNWRNEFKGWSIHVMSACSGH